MDQVAEEFVSLLAQSRLFTAANARDLLERRQAEAGSSAFDAAACREWLIEQGLITRYQSSLLERGHAEGYFLDRYKILDRIGRGRMAGVYRACDDSGATVAIKVLPPSKAKDPVLLARFRREARLALRLAHPNVVQTREVGEADGFNYLVMEFLQGETLDAYLHRTGKLAAPDSAKFLEQALAGLQHIHEKGLIHRDLKPGNMMLATSALAEAVEPCEQRLKILDFGLSRAMDEEYVPEPAPDVQLTAAGAMLGTPDYLAPEQARDARSADIRADIYSVGCMAYHMLTGAPPFPDKNAIRQMVRHATETPPRLTQLCADAPAYLQTFLDRMLAKNPADRFRTPAEALAALQTFSRETKSFTATPVAAAPAEVTRPLKSLDDSPAADFDFARTEAPTVKQPVFSPLPAGAATKTPAPSATPPDVAPPRDEDAEFVARAFARASRQKQKSAGMASVNPETAPTREAMPVVAMPVTQRPPARARFRVTHRDMLMFAAGAGTVLVALGLGAFLSWLFRAN